MSTEQALEERARFAYAARRRREDQDHQERIDRAITVLRERAGETLYEALEIRTEPSEWKLDGEAIDYVEAGRGRAIVQKLGLRIRYTERGYGQGGPPVELEILHRCERCESWYPAGDLSRGTSSFPAIERLGRYYTALEEGELEHPRCPATRRCEDDACLRPDPHYGHAPDVDAAEHAEPFPVAEPLSPFEGCPVCNATARVTMQDGWQEREGPAEIAIIGCGNPWHYELDREPDRELGKALRAWLEANAGDRAHAIGAALHEELEAALGKGSDA